MINNTRTIFKIRNNNEICMVVDKKGREITRQMISDVVGIKDIWACDIEIIKSLTDPQEIEHYYGSIDKKNKYFI